MNIKYYGTAAAEGIPGIFCACDICEKSREKGKKNIRTRSQALVDGKLLLDFPPDTYLHVLNYGLDMTAIKSCLITHSHGDHLYPADLEMRRRGFAYGKNNEELPPLDIYISPKSSEALKKKYLDKLFDEEVLRMFTIKPFTPFDVEGYTVTALKASHDSRIDPVFYMISKDKTLLYANDTGYFPEETWEYLAKNKPYLDFVSLDCTGITKENYRDNHMSLESNIEVKEKLIEIGCADEKTIFCAHHFSHNGGMIHDDFEPVAAQHGFIVSYDTMEVEF